MQKNLVFIASLVISLSVVGYGAARPEELDRLATFLNQSILENFGWLYLISAFLFLVFSLALAFSRFGNLKLGGDREKPQYSYFGWFSMLFAAGMGIGLIFWGVAEPLSHYLNPPEHIPDTTGQSAAFSMRYSFLHWGLHPWAVYIVMSLSIAYFSFRRKMPPLISSCFFPLLGDKIYGPWGYTIDVFSVLATIFGIATSLGLGAMQITSGLSHLFSIPDEQSTMVIVIAVATVLFMISSIVGLDKGIQLLSKSNLLVAGILLVMLLVIGPTAYIFSVFSSSLGEYFNRLLEMSLQANPFEGYEWTKSWTLFYWAWWISWSPFVGVFVARISRGRTIKEFILGALLVPSLLTFFWFSVMGGSGLHLELYEGISVAQVALDNPPIALFAVLENFPLGTLMSGLAVILLTVFFITSADSATFVLGMMSSGGDLHPAVSKKAAWGITQSSMAVVLLLSGGLEALQDMTIAAALPFTVIMLLLCYNLFQGLREDQYYHF